MNKIEVWNTDEMIDDKEYLSWCHFVHSSAREGF